MKKHYCIQSFRAKSVLMRCMKKIPLAMRCTLFMLFCLVGMTFANEGYAQKTMVNIALEDKTVDEVLTELEQGTEFVFFYNNKQIDVKRRVSVRANNKTIFKVLNDVFKGTNIGYKILDRNIILYDKAVGADGVQMALQAATVKGSVVDATGEPVIGASILVQGTTNGVITDIDGNFILTNVGSDATLIISYVGYKTQNIKVAGRNSFKIVLVEDAEILDEVVVVGYGVQKKSSVTGAISSVKAEDFENRTITNAEQALQGKTAGVQIISASAAPGSNPAIRIRGYSSNASSDPLYVVDGLRTKDISNLDPNDIESMEVLKDAASAAIYGAQAGNGVVLITTRKAKKGVRRISYDFQLSSQSLGRTPDILNAQEYVNYMTEGNLIPRETIDRYWDGKTNTDWIEETFESSMMQRHNVNFQGANDNGSLFASLSYLSNNGPIVGNKDVFDRITGTVNADYKVKDWLKFTTNNSFSRYHVQSVSEGSATGSLMLSAIQLDPLTPVTYTPDKLPDTMINYMNQGHTLLQNANGDYYSISPYGDSNNINPYIMRDRGTTKRDGFVFSGSTYLDFTPIKELVITSRLGYRYTYSNSYGYTMPNITCSDLYQDYVSVNATSSNTTYWQWENFANYTKTFADKHNVNVMLGMSYSSNTSFGVTGGINGSRSGDKVDLGITKLDPNYAYFAFQTGTATRTVSGGEKRRYANLSYFGRASYDYAGKYFAQFTLRADAADLSILPLQKRWGYFPAVSVGWVLSNEKFMENLKSISHLKLRASWGQNGSIAGWQTICMMLQFCLKSIIQCPEMYLMKRVHCPLQQATMI